MGRREDCKTQKTRGSAAGCLLGLAESSTLEIDTLFFLPKQDMHNDNTMSHVHMDGENITEPHS